MITDEPVELFLSEKQMAVWAFANEVESFSRGEATISATDLNP